MSAALKRFACGSCAVLAALVLSLTVFEGSAVAQGGPLPTRIVDAGFAPNAGQVRLYEDQQVASQFFKLDEAATVFDIQALVKTFSSHDHLYTYLTTVDTLTNTHIDTVASFFTVPPPELVSHVYHSVGLQDSISLTAGAYGLVFATADANDADPATPGPSIGATPFSVGPSGVASKSNVVTTPGVWASTFVDLAKGGFGIRLFGRIATGEIAVSDGSLNAGNVPIGETRTLVFGIDALTAGPNVRTQLDPIYSDDLTAQTDGPFSLPTPFSDALTAPETVEIQFAPTTEGVFESTVLLLTKDSQLPLSVIQNWGDANVLTIPIRGRGVLANQIIGLSQPSLSVSLLPDGKVSGGLKLTSTATDGAGFAFTVETEIIGKVWLKTGIKSGVVPRDGGVGIPLVFDATDLTDGTYTGNLVIRSQNPVGSSTLPVELIVDSAISGVAGAVEYYSNNTVGVEAVDVTPLPSGTATSTTTGGAYSFSGIIVGPEVILEFARPVDVLLSGTDERLAITAEDAVTVLQKAAFITTVDADQSFAGDVNGDSNLDNADALGILRYLAFLDTNIGSTGQWRFSPKQITATSGGTTTPVRAYLRGDVNGSFAPALAKPVAYSGSAALDASQAEWKDNELVLPVRVAFDGPVSSVLLSLEYDPAQLAFDSSQLTLAGARDYMMVSNGQQEGKVHIAMAGLPQAAINEPLFEIRFQTIGDMDFGESAELMVSRFVINDLVMPVGLSSVLEIQQAPGEFVLAQNSPNPFNPETQIRFSLPEGSDVRLSIYNLLGQEVRVLVNENLGAGFHTVVWDGRTESGAPAASGVYVYRISTNTGFSDSKRMLLLK